MQERADATETSTDLIGSSGAVMALQSCPDKGKEARPLYPSIKQSVVAGCPQEGRVTFERSSFLLLKTGPGKGLSYVLNPEGNLDNILQHPLQQNIRTYLYF